MQSIHHVLGSSEKHHRGLFAGGRLSAIGACSHVQGCTQVDLEFAWIEFNSSVFLSYFYLQVLIIYLFQRTSERELVARFSALRMTCTVDGVDFLPTISKLSLAG